MSGLLDREAFVKGVALSKPFLELAALADVHKRANRIAEVARQLAPVGSSEEGDTHAGELRDDIGIKGEGIDGKGPFVDVGTTVHTQVGDPYPLYVEFGTSKMQAQPFMRPALAAESGLSATGRVQLAPRSAKSQLGSRAARRIRK